MTDQRTAPQKKKKYLSTAIRIVVSVGLLTFLFYKMGPDNIFGAIRAADPIWVLAIFVLMFIEHMHGTYKWLILLRGTTSHVPFLPMLRVRYLSAFIGTFGLGAVTIELVRMYGLARYTSDLAMSFTSILMDRLLGLTGLSLMILIGVLIETRETVAGIKFWALGAMLLLLVGWLAIMNLRFRSFTDSVLKFFLDAVGKTYASNEADHNAQPQQSKKLLRRLKRTVIKITVAVLGMARDKQRKIYQSLDTYRGRPGLLAWGMVQSLLFNVLRILVVYAGAMAVGIEVPISAYFVVVPMVIFAMLIPISMSGWGVREAMFVSLLTLYGAEKETVLAMSLLIGICMVLSTLPGAVLLMTGMGAPKPNSGEPTPSEQT